MRSILNFSVALHLAAAIVYRDDIEDVNDYRPDPSEWPMTFPYRNFDCSATLISKRHAITAAHCFGNNQGPFDVKIDGADYTVIETR